MTLDNYRRYLSYTPSRDLLEAAKAWLADGIPSDVPSPEAFLLSMAVGGGSASVANEKELPKLAKSVIKKHGSEGVKAALKLLGRRKYSTDAAQEKFTADSKALEAVEGFDLAMFAKYVYVRHGRFHRAKHVFHRHSTHEQLVFHFRHDFGSDFPFSRKRRDGLLGIAAETAHAVKVRDALAETLADSEVADKVRSLTLAWNDDLPVDGLLKSVPNIAFLSIQIPLTTFPDVTECEQLLSLSFRQLEAELPNSLPPKLTALSLSGCSITRLPDVVGELPLRKLSLFGNEKLRSLPAALAHCKTLEEIYVESKALKAGGHLEIPEALLAADHFSKRTRSVIAGVATARNPLVRAYSTVNIGWNMEPFVALEGVKEVMRAWDGDPAKASEAGLGELALAIAKCTYDEEHGRSTNEYLLKEIGSFGSELEKAVNAIARPAVIGANTPIDQIEKAAAALDATTSFSGEKFKALVAELRGAINKRAERF